jgi:glycosyltransferase involved in cell wall biosynthesis
MAPDPGIRSSAPVPQTYSEYRGLHRGESILVCGCGSSLSGIIAPERLITVGVNDMGRLFDPDYLVVLNPPTQFSRERFQFIANSRARAIFTQLELGIAHPNIVRVKLGRKGSTDLSDCGTLPYTRNSPYPAICLAAHLGARRIGVLGVDFTANHFFARTGTHSLAPELAQIDREYSQLYQSCIRQGIEVFNLSEESRLTAFPRMSQQEFHQFALLPPRPPLRKVFFVNYQFLSCGHVFREGLSHAANSLGIGHQQSSWDDPELPRKISAFNPDLLFVAHGRKFSQRWRGEQLHPRSAVWLLDEPYEVDDTVKFSSAFSHVFLNDPATLARHRCAHYLPVCYDPFACSYLPAIARPHAVGFIGGHNLQREDALVRLAGDGALSYVVGGPWGHPSLQKLCLAPNIPAEQTASLYSATRIVINLFRSRHHFNHAGLPAFSLNPRIYEALGCGALVISEYRPELETVCPEIPSFRSLDEMQSLVDRFLRDPDLYAHTRKQCIRRLATHTYAERLASVLLKVFGAGSDSVSDLPGREDPVTARETPVSLVAGASADSSARPTSLHASEARMEILETSPSIQLPVELASDWQAQSPAVQIGRDGAVILTRQAEDGPGCEQGLVGRRCLKSVLLEFDLFLNQDTVFVAKLHQAEAENQSSNSYHLLCRGTRAYVARHGHVLSRVTLPTGRWVSLSFSCSGGSIVLRRQGAEIARIADATLREGFAFLGVKTGSAVVRNVRIQEAGTAPAARPAHFFGVLLPPAGPAPKVSIVTTVYDRVDCLENCLRSVQALHFQDYEHIVVADCPPDHIVRQIAELVEFANRDSGKLSLLNLNARKNDWGMTPAATGLSVARGQYVCFLSDDNGYAPEHFDRLVAALDASPGLGFVYSSCLWAGRGVLNSPVPRPGRIDLGQPLIRRELFERYFGGTLTFHEFGWDWRMIERLLRSGVRWQHINAATFIFRLAMYPEWIPPRSRAALCRNGISYCIACLRPTYARRLIDDLIAKTTAPFEILLWLNVVDPEFDAFLASRIAEGAPIRIVGRSPENIGMAAYPRLFDTACSPMVAQIDDDVVCVSPRIAETAREIFDRFPNVGMLTADVWQDEFTSGARPPLRHYRAVDREFGLFEGPIDGWFAVYRRSSLSVCQQIAVSRYFCLGCAIKNHLATLGQVGLLCRRIRVFHVVDAPYVAYFGMLDAEIAKYRMIGRQDLVSSYTAARATLPPLSELAGRVQGIVENLREAPQINDL